ncbi:MAG: hypothetical protein RL092_2152 [Bacteroidota bacterium]|jgi:phage-related protein
MEQSKKFRKVIFYKSYFDDFLVAQSIKVQKKIIWTIELIEDLEMVPDIYFKHLENTKGLYEIRVQQGKNNYRIFCFFEKEKLIVATSGFYKKTQKTPIKELQLALRIKEDYEKEKHTKSK